MEGRLWHLVGIILVGVLLSTQASREEARIVTAEEGKSITVKCSTTKNAASMYLYQRMESQKEVLYYYRNPAKCTPSEEYVGRVETEGEMLSLSITITNITDDDTGLYWCSYNVIQDTDVIKFTSNYTLGIVNGDLKPCPPAEPVLTPSLWVTTAICAGFVLLLSVVILLFCLGPKIRKACSKKKTCTITKCMKADNMCISHLRP